MKWLTTSNRIIRLYVSTVAPEKILIKHADFVMRAYAMTWFEIKRNLYVISGHF